MYLPFNSLWWRNEDRGEQTQPVKRTINSGKMHLYCIILSVRPAVRSVTNVVPYTRAFKSIRDARITGQSRLCAKRFLPKGPHHRAQTWGQVIRTEAQTPKAQEEKAAIATALPSGPGPPEEGSEGAVIWGLRRGSHCPGLRAQLTQRSQGPCGPRTHRLLGKPARPANTQNHAPQRGRGASQQTR